MADADDLAELVRRLRSNDESVRAEAQKKFVEKYKVRICRSLRILLRDFGVILRPTTVGGKEFSTQVNSLFNDVWLATISRLHSGDLTDGELDLIAYMIKTAKRFLIDRKRKELRRRTYGNEHPESISANDPPPEVLAAERELVEMCRGYIAGLPKSCQLLITLRIHESLSFAEIGEIMNITRDRTRARYHRCLELLRDTAGEK